MKEEHSQLNHFVEILKNLSLIGSLFTGIGVAVLFFLGVALYDTFNVMLGIPLFDFSFQKCLEFGGACVVSLMTLLPLILFVGVIDFFKEANFLICFIFSIPLIMYFILWLLKNHNYKWRLRVQKIAHFTLLIYVGVLLIWIYIALASLCQTKDLLLNPEVNILVEHRKAVLANIPFNKIGLPHMDNWTANIVAQNETWVFGKIGGMYIIVGLGLMCAVFSFFSSGRFVVWLIEKGYPFPKWLIYIRRGFCLVSIAYLIFVLFLVPARTMTVLNINFVKKHKVNVDIKGLEALTSKYYFILVGDYDQRYALYQPNKQEVIIVQKDKINSVILMEPVSLFDDRSLFTKSEAADQKK